jgi:hypothetical protein
LKGLIKLNDEYIFRELNKKPLELIFCDFMNSYYSKKEKTEKIQQIRKKFPDNIIWIMTTKKGFSPLRSEI